MRRLVSWQIDNVHLFRGDYTTVIDYYRRALALAHEIKDPVSIRKWNCNLNLSCVRMRAAVDQAGESFLAIAMVPCGRS